MEPTILGNEAVSEKVWLQVRLGLWAIIEEEKRKIFYHGVNQRS